MSGSEFDFPRLLAPMRVNEFITEYWERRPLIVTRNQPDHYAGLLSRADLDRALSPTEADGPTVTVVGRKEARTHKIVAQGASESTASAPQQVLAEYQRGATLKFSYLDRKLEPLSALCRSIEHHLNGSVGTEIYLTPAGSQGFAAHHDIYNVFVLQLEGTKHWRIYDTPVPLPRTGEEEDHHHHDDHTHAPLGNILHEVDLTAGDLLYFPRGFVHEALTSNAASLSITIGVQAYTWTDLIVRTFLALDARDPRFRQALPANFAMQPEPTPAMHAQFTALLQTFSEQACLSEGLSNLAERFVRFSHPPLDGALADVEAARDLTLETVLCKRAGLACRIFPDGDDTVRLVGPQWTLRLPKRVAPALRFILEADTFALGELPNSLTTSAKLVLVRRLITDGFLTIVQDRGHNTPPH